MPDQSHLAVCLLDNIVLCVPFHSQDFVKTAHLGLRSLRQPFGPYGQSEIAVLSMKTAVVVKDVCKKGVICIAQVC